MSPGVPVPTYLSYVAGKEIDSDRYVYTVGARSILTDLFGSLTLKRRLEQGQLDPAAVADRVVGRCALADEDTMAAAVAAAAEAAPVWGATPLAVRVELALALRQRILAGHKDLVDVLIAEGNPRPLAEWQVAGMLSVASEETVGWLAGQLEQEFRHGDRRLLLRRRPDGVVCVNPPQNAPATSALFGATALMAGNTVVVRAPRSAPFGVMHVLREYVVPALAEIGAPPGVLNMFCGRPGPALRSWLADPLVDDIFYTGGVERGLELERDCVAAGKKPILELAGNDCVVIWRDADLDLAVEALTECFYGSGQICMVPNQAVVHPAIAEQLIAKLHTAVTALRPGYPDEPDVLLSPVLRAERFGTVVEDALARGATLICGGGRLEVDGEPSETGPFLAPTVLRVDGLDTCRELTAVREETFFPLLPVVVPGEAPDEELLAAVLAFVDSNRYGLRNSLWAKDELVIEEFLAKVGNGGLLKVNDSHIGFLPYLPTHGGTGLTGGAFGEANYLVLRTTHLQGVSIAENVRPSAAVFEAYTRITEPGA
ncbi:aldehyde dehydrogenase [Crossiella sp. CA-258035]|uniref:aldehyde dehydrogenase family protein n=1 Tax=Crossiella sp. CA-258035 TaxID=2981138 RepID=UPI0024BD502C|nr:aldehyde dehydrogenase [Crossiella sp. CA-258035]WHT17448.1 aldehyde dehydrogenase [Crossiella sp. CA-258035]